MEFAALVLTLYWRQIVGIAIATLVVVWIAEHLWTVIVLIGFSTLACVAALSSRTTMWRRGKRRPISGGLKRDWD